jgi:hypothetical protein
MMADCGLASLKRFHQVARTHTRGACTTNEVKEAQSDGVGECCEDGGQVIR